MLEEYIMEQLRKAAMEKEKLKQTLEQLMAAESEARKQLTFIAEEEDLELEIFSPRSGVKSVKEQVEEIQKQIDEIRNKISKTAEHIDKNRNELKKWEKLLEEARKNPDKVPEIGQTAENQDASYVSDAADATGAAESTAETRIDSRNEESVENAEGNTEKNHYSRELEKIIARVDRCLSLVHSDRIKCKSELKSLKYYLKALAAEHKN